MFTRIKRKNPASRGVFPLKAGSDVVSMTGCRGDPLEVNFFRVLHNVPPPLSKVLHAIHDQIMLIDRCSELFRKKILNIRNLDHESFLMQMNEDLGIKVEYNERTCNGIRCSLQPRIVLLLFLRIATLHSSEMDDLGR